MCPWVSIQTDPAFAPDFEPMIDRIIHSDITDSSAQPIPPTSQTLVVQKDTSDELVPEYGAQQHPVALLFHDKGLPGGPSRVAAHHDTAEQWMFLSRCRRSTKCRRAPACRCRTNIAARRLLTLPSQPVLPIRRSSLLVSHEHNQAVRLLRRASAQAPSIAPVSPKICAKVSLDAEPLRGSNSSASLQSLFHYSEATPRQILHFTSLLADDACDNLSEL